MLLSPALQYCCSQRATDDFYTQGLVDPSLIEVFEGPGRWSRLAPDTRSTMERLVAELRAQGLDLDIS